MDRNKNVFKISFSFYQNLLCMDGRDENAYNTFVGEPDGKNYLKDLGVDGKII
jgi:hypothetical protein